jgi:hypothetical protein
MFGRQKYESGVELGRMYRDELTGFEGRATGVFFFEFGCVRVALESRTLKDNGDPRSATFDEPRLVEVTSDRLVEASSAPMGPRPEPSRARPEVRRRG